jgi:hypothetical protein
MPGNPGLKKDRHTSGIEGIKKAFPNMGKAF